MTAQAARRLAFAVGGPFRPKSGVHAALSPCGEISMLRHNKGHA